VKNGVWFLNKLYVVGIGPGSYEQMTVKACETLKKCDVIAGYTVYIDLIKEHFSGKEFIETPMKKEKDRCLAALESANKGKTTAVVSSGDAEVYAMAGLIIELSENFKDVEIEIVPGITAALSGGAILGSPITSDFAVISLSDLLTPWDTIEKRLRMAVEGDFVVCIYNPSSKKRHDYLKKVCKIIEQYRDKNTVCGIVKNIGRHGEERKIMSLESLETYETDMFTTVFVGNSKTKIINGFMVTPRGYRI
jgi:precorrin-3B C17-methyltransferase